MSNKVHTFREVLGAQRKVTLVAIVLAVLGLFVGQYGDWILAGCIAGGILLGLVNHLAAEYWGQRTINSGREVTRGALTRSTIVRLTGLTAIAIGVAVAFYPDGIALLLALAIFRLIALVMTALPLLKELKNA
ncbi:MAG: hypothetical protein ACTHJM_02945 [Marmoricola sp.]